jgi:hypothetical protein
VDHALQLGYISLSGMNLRRCFLDLLSSNIHLIIERVGTIHQSLSLLIQDVDPRALRIALLLPLGESAIVLVDDSLLALSKLLLLIDAVSQVLIFPLKLLVV